MLNKIIAFYRISSDKPPIKSLSDKETLKRYKQLRWSTFLSATIGYGLYYVCRLSFNIVKKPIVDAGVFSETDLGVIGSALFFTYAIGKFTNGFLADRANVKRLMATGLLVTAVINLILGFTHYFLLFVILWGINGWAQSLGAASGVVNQTRWFSRKERGTYYGFWSASHNLGDALTNIVVAGIVGFAGWQWGFYGAATVGFLGFIMLYLFMHDRPESLGLQHIEPQVQSSGNKDSNTAQLTVLRNPLIWILALSSALMYVSRYAIQSWGIFFLQNEKHYTIETAGTIIAFSSIAGIIGTVFSGIISDKLFKGNRNIPAFLFGIINAIAMTVFLLGSANFWIDALAMAVFGIGIGVLICFLGGLMAVDIAPPKASGAALGIIGIASYIGAGVQDILSGVLIEGSKIETNGTETYNFSAITYFWVGAAVLSAILALLARKKHHKDTL